MAYPGVAGLLPSANLSHYFQDFVCPARTCKAAQVAILTLNAFASAKHTQMPPVCLELVNWASRAGHYLITLLPGGADVHPWEKEFLQALEMVEAKKRFYLTDDHEVLQGIAVNFPMNSAVPALLKVNMGAGPTLMSESRWDLEKK